jgi:alpha-L-fucosidase
LRIPGSATEPTIASTSAFDFAPIFNRESKKWNRDRWATIFREAGARCVVLTRKHHEGFTLWPSTTTNRIPTLLLNACHAERDIVADLTSAVRKQGMKMGLHYSGGYGWTFNTGPIETSADYQADRPET